MTSLELARRHIIDQTLQQDAVFEWMEENAPEEYKGWYKD